MSNDEYNDFLSEDNFPTQDELLAMQYERARSARPMGEGLEERLIKPDLTEEKYREHKKQFPYLRPETPTQIIEPNVVYRDAETRDIKFLLLSKAIQFGPYVTALEALQNADWQKSSRTANGQVLFGKKITVGWIKLPYPGYDNMRTAPTMEQPRLLAALYPLLLEMDEIVHEKLPAYHSYATGRALTAIQPDGEADDLSRIKKTDEYLEYERIKSSEPPWPPLDSLSDEEIDKEISSRMSERIGDPYQIVRNIDPWGMFYTIRGTVFSTVELNRNIVFRAHEDGHNVKGTLVCIAALGTFVGGRLVFPRYGYSAELGQYDLLICDNNHELHGNLGPIVGNRFSVVAFLHDSVCGRVPVHDGLDGKISDAPNETENGGERLIPEYSKKVKRLTNTTSCLEEEAKHGTGQSVLRHAAVARLAAKIQVESLIDPMAGAGIDAERFMAPITWVNDTYPKCLEILRTKFQNVSSYDFFKAEERAALFSLCKPDLVYLDFNNFTIAKWASGEYRAELDYSFAAAQKFLILNDCSYHSLRMGWQRKPYSQILGTPVHTADEYLAALPAFFKKQYPEWTLTDEEHFFHASPKGNGGTAYLLFRKV